MFCNFPYCLANCTIVQLQPLPLPLRLLLSSQVPQVSEYHGSGLVQVQLLTASTPPLSPTVLREVVSPSCSSATQQQLRQPSLTSSVTQTTPSLWWPLLENTGGSVLQRVWIFRDKVSLIMCTITYTCLT